MKIVHVIFSLTTGGTETMLVDILNEQIKYIAVELIIINNIINPELLSRIDGRVKIIRINRKPKNFNLWFIIKLNYLLIKSKYNTIHCHTHTIVKIVFYSLRKKMILTVHDIGYKTENFKKYKYLYSISRCVHDDLLTRYNLSSEIIYNGICCEYIKNKEKATNCNFKIIVIGRLEHKKKGQDLLIKALRILKDDHNIDFVLDIIGTGSSLPYLIELVNECGLSNHVNFLGLKSRIYIYENLCNYDLFVQPSIFEGFGLTVAEALASRTPVLVSNSDGPIEIIENGKFGFFFKKGDVNDLLKEILYIHKNIENEIVKEKVNKGFEHVYSNFDIKNVALNYINAYK